MSTQNALVPACPASAAGARCRNQKRHATLGLVCLPQGRTAPMPLVGVARCPYPDKADVQQTEKVCKKHGRGVEVLSITGTTMGAEFCLACSLDMLGGLLPPVAEVEKALTKPALELLEEVADDGGLAELPLEEVTEEQPVGEVATEDVKPDPEPAAE